MSPIRDKDPEYNFGKPLVPSIEKIFGREKSRGSRVPTEENQYTRKGEILYLPASNDYTFNTQGSDATLNHRRFKRSTNDIF